MLKWTGRNFADILILISLVFSKATILHFWKRKRVKIVQLKLPRQFSLSGGFMVNFWRISC